MEFHFIVYLNGIMKNISLCFLFFLSEQYYVFKYL